jgi:hypothetical protein
VEVGASVYSIGVSVDVAVVKGASLVRFRAEAREGETKRV